MAKLDFQVDVQNTVNDIYTGNAVNVSSEMFGAVNTAVLKNNGYEQLYDALNLNAIRWPGGGVAEGWQRVDANGAFSFDESLPYLFDLKYPDLLHPNAVEGGARLGFGEALSFAIDSGSSFTLIIPTKRYSSSIESAYEDVKSFLKRLFIDKAYGEIPEKLSLDIGNENYDSPGQNYGPVAASILQAIREFRGEYSELDFKVGLQAMQSSSGTEELIGYFENINTGGGSPNLLNEVDIVRVHALQQGLFAASKMEEQGSNPRDSLDMLHAAIEATGRSADDIEVSFSAWSAVSNPNQTVGLEPEPAKGAFALSSVSSMLSLFTSMLELGADSAAVWGVAVSENLRTSIAYVDETDGREEIVISPSAEVFRMMAESLPGMNLLYTESLDAKRGSSDAFLYAFSNSSQAVLFLAADDLSETTNVSINIENLGDIARVWVEYVHLDGSYQGSPFVERSMLDWDGNSIEIDLERDYDVVRIVVDLVVPDSPVMPFSASDGNDLLLGSNRGDDFLSGLGDDTVRAGNGDDTIDGESGADWLSGGNGRDRINGGFGNDIISGDAGSDTLIGGGGNDTLYGNSDDDVIAGGLGHDFLWGGKGDDTLRGGSGNDRLRGNSGSDTLLGEDGRDTIEGATGNDRIEGGEGDDQMSGGNGNDTIIAGNGNDRSIGGSGNDDILGGEGDDTIFGNGGADTLLGGTGDDVLLSGFGNDELNGGSGDDWLAAGAGDDLLDGGEHADTLDGGSGDDVLIGGAGADEMIGGTGFDIASYAIASHAVRISLEDPSSNTGDGAGDSFVGIEGLLGSYYDDTLSGDVNDNFLNGSSGDDLLNGGGGADVLIGGTGNDTVSYEGSYGSLRVDMLYSQLNTNIAAGDTYSGIENLTGSRGFDNLRGTYGDNYIRGMENVDYIFGRRGNDTLEGGIGDDVLFGGVGQDVLIGGDHRDRAQYSLSQQGLLLDLADPTRNTGEAAGDLYVSIEDLAGSSFADTIYGDANNNRLFGREEEDQLFGRAGDDYLNGGGHADTLDGGDGNDTLRGGNTRDTFIFNDGQDVIEDFFFDNIEIDRAVWGGTVNALLNGATVENGNLVLDFGNENTLTLNGITDVATIENYITII